MNGLQLIRLKCNLSQKQVGFKIGKTDSYMSALENGKINVSLDEASRLAYVYNSTLDEIYLAIKELKNTEK
ncbi:MAG: helix-turn-helix transcriptional regulator [Cetobacterium sp.]|uniref:helix-turn-helix transcriptional regulator n=1 Tax=Bacteria TaxID=2 RepID=UPI002FC95FF8